MKKSSSIESYLNRFQNWIRLFPQSFQDEYGEQMLQTMRDQLTEAAEHKVPLQDIYYSSLSELPGSLAREHLRSRKSLPQALEKSTSLTWFIFGIVLSAYAVVAGTTAVNTLAVAVGSIAILILFVWYGIHLT